MLNQLDLFGKTKLETTLERLRMFEPEDGYYVAFSGGKDSQCIYELCKMAGVKFDAHYNVTSVDPPELIAFIKKHYQDVIFEYPRDKNGKRVTMWRLIENNTMPPTRMARYCCEKLKESSGDGRVTVTGVRWAESVNRKANQGLVTVFSGSKKTQKALSEIGADYQQTARGGVVLNLDNAETRRAVEICYRTRKTLVNPIIDWDEAEVWEFLNEIAKVPHCTLYDEGFTRLGCIGCPLAGGAKMKRDFKRWPKYKDAYIRAFVRMVKTHPGIIKIGRNEETPEKQAEVIMQWWLGELKDVDF